MSSTTYEYLDTAYYVRIQHCEHKDKQGVVCDEYLGVNYPTPFCSEHDK